MSQLREYRTNQPFLQCNVTAFLVKTKIFGLITKVLTGVSGKSRSICPAFRGID